jgi:hypothetical protein
MNSKSIIPAIYFALYLITPALAEKGEAFNDVKSAGPDYALQGEYQGTVDIGGGEEDFGTQIIALGDGKFQLVAFQGGLPGDGWSRNDQQMEGEGDLADGKITAVIEGADIEVADGTITVTAEGETIGTMKKVERKSPTLGKQPTEEAIVLFDGKSVGMFDNGELVDGKHLGATNATSKEKFGDHQMHIEFRTPFMPAARGQGRGNSGVYVQGRYELQVLDSFGLDGKDNECGGIYSISEPKVNMCFPPLVWQTYDIDFVTARYDDDGKKTKNARVTIKHNGVLIHDDLEIEHGTPGHRGEGPGDEHLYLQHHGNPVVFRNIWVVKK